MKEHQRLEREVHVRYQNVFELLEARCQERPDQLFLISLHQTEARYTYREFVRSVLAARAFLTARGLIKGDAINLIIQNSAEFLSLYFAALSLGIVVAPVNYNFASREMLYVIQDSCGKLVFSDPEYLPRLEEIAGELEGLAEIVPVAEGLFAELMRSAPGDQRPPSPAAVGPDDRAVIIYTSGTSGNPKGAILTHGNLLADAQAIAEWFGFDSQTRTLCILPLFHNNGQIPTTLAPLWAGGSTIMIKGNVSLKSFWDLAQRYRATWSSVIPTILSVLLSFKIHRTDTTMQGILCGGALLPRRVQEEFEAHFGVPIFEGYGLTETTSFSCFNPLAVERRKIGSVGLALPVNEMAIVDDEGREVPCGTVGEICIRGHNVFAEYCKLPERNATAFRGGWFHSGDYGHHDEDGFFYVEGRRDDLIIKGGENIYPREIENVLYTHPKVKECAALGVEHPLWGETIAVFVDTADNARMDRAEVVAFLKNKIADYKIPSEIYFLCDLEGLKELPKGPTRKILRKELRRYHQTRLRSRS